MRGRAHSIARVLAILTLAFGGLCALGARPSVAQSFNFSYTFNGVNAVGVFNTTSLGGGSYRITSINGTYGGNSMTLLAPGAYDGNDNQGNRVKKGVTKG